MLKLDIKDFFKELEKETIDKYIKNKKNKKKKIYESILAGLISIAFLSILFAMANLFFEKDMSLGKAFIMSILSLLLGLGVIIPISFITFNIFNLKMEKSNEQFLKENRFIPMAYNYSLINLSHLTLEKIINLKENDILDYEILCEDGKNHIIIKTNSQEFKILIDKIELPKNNETKDLVLYVDKNIVGLKA